MTAQQPSPEQDRALRTLEERGTLTAEQAGACVALWSSTGTAARGANPASVLIEVAGYVGGGLMLGGAGLLIGLNYDRLGRTGTAWALAGYALALALAAVVVAAGPHRIVGLRQDGSPVRRRLVGVLMALASGPAAVAVAVVTEPTRPSGPAWSAWRSRWPVTRCCRPSRAYWPSQR